MSYIWSSQTSWGRRRCTQQEFQLSFFCVRNLQVEYEQLKDQHLRRGLPVGLPPDSVVSPHHTSEDSELIAEAKLLRQHKGRLEARMQILEDHNKQLESQLHRLRQLLEQVECAERGAGPLRATRPSPAWSQHHQRGSLSISHLHSSFRLVQKSLFKWKHQILTSMEEWLCSA